MLEKGYWLNSKCKSKYYFGSGALPCLMLDLRLLKVSLGLFSLFLSPAGGFNPAGAYPDLKRASILLFSIILTSNILPESAPGPNIYLLGISLFYFASYTLI